MQTTVRDGRSTPQVFLSYTRENAEGVQRLETMLRDAGLDVWWDAEVPAGGAISSDIADAIKEARAILIVLGPETENSSWVPIEVAASVAARIKDPSKVVVPVLTSPEVEIPDLLRDVTPVRMDVSDKELESEVAILAQMIENPPTRRLEDMQSEVDKIDKQSDEYESASAAEYLQRSFAVHYYRGTIALGLMLVLDATFVALWFTGLIGGAVAIVTIVTLVLATAGIWFFRMAAESVVGLYSEVIPKKSTNRLDTDDKRSVTDESEDA